jgi:hypothetical protein
VSKDGGDNVKLTAEVAKSFGRLKARIKAATEKCEQMSKEIKAEMKHRGIDEFAPKSSPYKLVKTEYDQTSVSYETMAQKAYRELYGRAWKAQFEKDKQAFGSQHVVRLEVKENENWKENP